MPIGHHFLELIDAECRRRALEPGPQSEPTGQYEPALSPGKDPGNGPQLIDAAGTLRRAIRLRNPYVDPMSLLQVDLLKRWRESDRQDDAVLQALMVSINGIAHGMQNTG